MISALLSVTDPFGEVQPSGCVAATNGRAALGEATRADGTDGCSDLPSIGVWRMDRPQIAKPEIR